MVGNMKANLFVLLANLVFTYSKAPQTLNLSEFSPERFVTVYDPEGNKEVIDTRLPLPEARAVVSTDVLMKLYTLFNYDEAEELELDADAVASSKYFNPKLETIVIIHGWRNDHSSDINTFIRDAYLLKLDVNILVIDWSVHCTGSYLAAFTAVPQVGELVGLFLIDLQHKLDLAMDDFVLIGHSLGAHVAGCVGATLGGEIKIIIGLDPAGPLFFNGIKDNRLDPSDARFVHVIHTSGGYLGYKDSLGTVDIFPNGGSSQPGCGMDIVKTCAHGRAFEYFAESLAYGGFTTYRCESYTQFGNGHCYDNATSYLGGVIIDTSASGDYYLDTNSESPYSIN